MKRISSTVRPTMRKVIALLFLIIAIIIAYAIIVNSSQNSPSIFIVAPLLIGATFLYLKKTETVYIDKNNFVVRGEKILITDVISMDRQYFKPVYIVKYYHGKEIKSFKLEIDTFQYIAPDYVKKLLALVEKNNHKTQ